MTKERARQLLDDYLELHSFPIVDAIVWSYTDEQGNLTQWTFVALLRIAYDL
jgi:hypothetical protein